MQYLSSYTVETQSGPATLRSTIDSAVQLHFNVGYEILKEFTVTAYGSNAARPVQETTKAALLNMFGIRYDRRELGLQAAYRF